MAVSGRRTSTPCAALGSGDWPLALRRCDRSAYDGRWRLHLEIDDVIDMESDGPLDDGSYLFNGGVERATGKGERALEDLSSRLRDAGVPHCLELVDDDGNIERRFHHLWPEDREKPDVPMWTARGR